MVLAVAALLFQFSPISYALPAAIPAHPAAAAIPAPEPKSPDTTLDTSMNAKLTPDLNSAHYAKNSVSSSEPGTSASNSSGLYSPANVEFAPNALSLSNIRIAESEPVKENKIILVERPSRRAWLALSFAQHGAAAFDAYSTRRAVSRGAVEANPIMRPFANSSGLYAAIQVGPVVLDLVSRKMQRSQNGFIRRMWWLPQSVSTAGFIFSGVHNLNVVGHP